MGRHRTGKGYVNLGRGSYSREHQIVVLADGQDIPVGSLVHHIDEDVRNNSIDNLHVMTRAEHQKLHFGTTGEPNRMEYVEVVCPLCLSIRKVQYRCTISSPSGICKSCNGRINGVHALSRGATP